MTTIPASRVAAQDQGAALAHATHSTQAPAAQSAAAAWHVASN